MFDFSRSTHLPSKTFVSDFVEIYNSSKTMMTFIYEWCCVLQYIPFRIEFVICFYFWQTITTPGGSEKEKKKKKLFGKHLPVRLSTELALEECCCCYCWLASSGYCFRNVRLESAVKIQQLATSNKLCGKESWHSHYMLLLLASMEMGKLDKLSFSLFLSFVFVYSCFVVWQRKLLPRQLCSRFYFSSVL